MRYGYSVSRYPVLRIPVLCARNRGLTAQDNQLWHQSNEGIDDDAEGDDGFGDALVAGDFNGDGCDDLAIGVPEEDVVNGK